MKSIIKYLAIYSIPLLSSYFVGCKNTEENDQQERNKEDVSSMMTEMSLSIQKEKIFLLSIMKNVQYDTLYSILKDYGMETYGFSFKGDKVNIENAINAISKKYKIEKSKLASLLFCFIYEMQVIHEGGNDYQADPPEQEDEPNVP